MCNRARVNGKEKRMSEELMFHDPEKPIRPTNPAQGVSEALDINDLEEILGALRGKHGEGWINITMRERRLFAKLLEDRIAAIGAGGQAVAVRALEWRGSEGVWHKADAEFGGHYRITQYVGMQKPYKLETHGWWSGSPCGHYEFLDEAKAAAQADYERRIMSALSNPPAQPGWRDMESAPRDGTKIDLWVKPHDAEANGNVGRITDAWFEGGEWRRVLAGWTHYVSSCGEPIGWMPIHAAPLPGGAK